MTRLKTLTIQFDTQLVENEIQRFRGAIIKLLPQKEVLFHNHINDGYRYAYPLIQYKRLNNKAALFCIGEGVENIGVFFASNNFNVRIGNKRHCLQIEEVNAKLVDIACDTEQIYSYQLTNWLPLNEENYSQFTQTSDTEEQLIMLQRILTGNILSMLKGLGIRVEQRVEVHIKHLEERPNVIFKGVKLYCANISFDSNVLLPQHVGLGKHASVGFGILTATTINK
ncbi:CRISPR-associated endonuclease Cas6 [Hoylesella shahii]|uniref:CRISPR-associated endonuclease Cas6 n=1 Tax=Hoylesella shahii TaxID=228603 RepID=UPI001CB3A503|nr:CRISPR-associated endonuclease Cas6 [Hoylesella shahii]MBF1577113.1 CRISPR-associated endonuclease Cas6 [Hoylesella shahii]